MDFVNSSSSGNLQASTGKPTADPRGRQSKQPYIKPAFRFEQVFVTSALACGKIDDTQKHCFFNRKAS